MTFPQHLSLLILLPSLSCTGSKAESEDSNIGDSSDDTSLPATDSDDTGGEDPPPEHSPGDIDCHDAFDDKSDNPPHRYDLIEWRSPDGTTWTEHRLFHACADVPSIASDNAGTVLMAFQNFQDQGDDTRFDKVALRRSTDHGETWGEPSPANLIGLPPEAARPFDPTIVWNPATSQWRMYFSMSSAGSLELNESVCTHSAISDNGIDFTYEPGPRYCADGTHVIDPAVSLLGDTWYYSAPRGAPQDGAHLATSADGVDFTIGPPAPSDTNHGWTGNLVEVDGVLRFYGREVLIPSGNVLWWTSTSDGVEWSDYTQTNIPAGKDPGLLRLEDGSFIILVPTILE